MKKYLPLFFILCVAGILRFAYLGIIPNAVSGDESHYVVTAKSVYLTGHDLSGSWNPWSLLWFRYPPNEHQAELPYLLHFVSSAPYPFSLFLIKLPFALLSVGVVVVLYLIGLELFGTEVAVAVGFLAAINPWMIVMGRTGYEATPSMFFYLLAFWLIVRLKHRNILWCFVPLFFAFYSYIGTKIILVPYTGVISVIAYLKNGKRYTRVYALLISLTVAVTIAFFFLTTSDPSGSRLGEIFLPNSPSVAGEVNAMRSTTIATPLTKVVINKYVIYTQSVLNKIFRIISPTYLFVDGDQFFLPIRQGFFYYPDAIFLLTGAVFIAVKYRKNSSLLWMLAAVGALPQVISTTTGDFAIHLSMMFPILLIFAGAGIYWTIHVFPKKYRTAIIYICVLLYAMNIVGFTESYFFRSPLIGYADFPKRILTKYLQLAGIHNIPVTVYAQSTSSTFQKYILYADKISIKNMSALQNTLNTESINFNGIRFLTCQTDIKINGSTGITDRLCGKPASQHHDSITTLTDGGENYIIEEDRICNKYALKRYPQNITFADFNIERLSEKQFCETYISQR
jgi:4-amino-4-deoxy-L-arabinose transferase-like glycosyltransferase